MTVEAWRAAGIAPEEVPVAPWSVEQIALAAIRPKSATCSPGSDPDVQEIVSVTGPSPPQPWTKPMSLWILCSLLSLPVQQPTGPIPWPVPLTDPEPVEHVDLNHDGALDDRVEASNSGSGFGESSVCVRDGTSGDIACETQMYTAYSVFSGSRRTLSPARANHAAAALGEDDCARADPADPSQGAMWALRTGDHLPLPATGPVKPRGP